MTDAIVQNLTPILVSVIVLLLGAIATAAGRIAGKAVKALAAKAEVWLISHSNEAERALIHKLAAEAFTFAETVYKEHNGDRKLDEARTYLVSLLHRYGINITEAELKAVIEKAVQEYNLVVKSN